MTREKLLAAIRLGIKRGSGNPEQIADSIEMAFELEGFDGEIPAHPTHPEEEPEIGVPVNTAAVETNIPESAPEVIPPPPAAGPSLVTLATERDMEAATRPQLKPARIRSLSPLGPARARMKLEDAVQFWMDNAPERISVVVEGRAEPVILEKSVAGLPGHKAPGSSKKSDDFVKLSYKHPAVDSSFEVQYPVPVSEMERGLNVDVILEDLKAKARIIYKPRPKSIEPRRPTPEALRIETAIGTTEGTPDDQDRMAAAARSGKVAVEQLSKQIRGG